MQKIDYSIIVILAISLLFSCKNEPITKENKSTKAEKEIVKSKEPHRPTFHFTPPEKWMNDPNGMVYYEDEYHLFYQFYPDSTVWGPMHWGHAISSDMVTWEHLSIALYPDELGYIFSGSAVIDWKNTSGFGKDGEPPMIAIFTHHEPEGAKKGTKTFQYQSIAYSNDKGRTWTKYAGNPVIPNPGIKDFRDPKVIWDDDSDQWVMVFAAWDHVKFYGSPNLKDWTHLSDFGKEWGTHAGVWECPDLFPLIVKGKGEKKWVLLQSLNPGGPNGGSGTQYFIGDFDGKNFIIDGEFAENFKQDTTVWLDYGRDNYAGVTWSDIPQSDGRKLFIGWMSNWDYAQIVPTESWRSAMTVARNLVLKRTNLGLMLFSEPVKELAGLRKSTEVIDASKAPDGFSVSLAADKKVVGEVNLKFSIPKGAKTKITLELSNTKNEKYQIGYNAATNEFFSDRRAAGKIAFSDKFADKIHTAPRFSENPIIELQIFLDVASAELFADKGWTVMTDIFFPNEDFNQLELIADGEIELYKSKVHWY